MKKCNDCLIDKVITEFEHYLKDGRTYIRNTCKKCRNKKVYANTKVTGRYDRKRNLNKKQRHDPRFRARFVLSDSIASDRKFGLTTDVDKQFIQNKIDEGCLYCNQHASTEMKIGIDRIDNNIGHMKTNVNACCSRCNFIRGSMPYAAWMLLVPAIKKATELGLLDDWVYGFSHHIVKSK